MKYVVENRNQAEMTNHRLEQNDEAGTQLDNSVLGTMKIDPNQYKAVEKNKDNFARTKYAVAGLLYLLRHEQSIRNLLIVSTIVMGLVFWLQVEMIHGVVVFLSLGVVWATESLNTAIEATVDLVTQKLHPMAKVAKDVGATATLAATFTSATTSLVLLVPPLLEKLGVA